MRKIFLTTLLSFPLLLFSQGENNHWYFGTKAAVKFASPIAPTVLIDSDMGAGSSPVGSVSDSNGKLLFYTDGKSVWNREHQMMNGNILNGGVGSPYGIQLAILKHPSNSNLYYIFNPVPYLLSSTGTMTPGISNYSIIDISAGAISTTDGMPLGDFVANSISIPFIGADERSFSALNVGVVEHADKKSFWVLIPNQDKIYSYLVGDQGIVNYPVISNMPFPTINYNYNGGAISYMKISPMLNNREFSNFVYVSYWGGGVPDWTKTRIMSFDNATGKITSQYLLDIDMDPQQSSSAEFNKDGSIMYVANNSLTKVYGLDMTSTSNPVPHYLLPVNNNNPELEARDIQRNKYGDIYIGYGMNTDYLAKIINPDIFNAGNVDVNNVYLQGRSTTNVLPQLNQRYGSSANQCLQDITLNSQELNNVYTYQVSNTIKTEIAYSINPGTDITMKAGQSITLLPNTNIKGRYFATIEDCPSILRAMIKRVGNENVRLSLDLRTKKEKLNTSAKISIYPNPVSDILNIGTFADIKNVSITDLSGKSINVRPDGNKIDVRSLPAGNYIINIETKEGKTATKFIKK
nr:T9SS type A sorting domain-containing protein [uncultured Chryseobacterium sp.]